MDITPQDLLGWENEKRPTTIQYYYQRCKIDGRPVLVAAATVADAIAHDVRISGFPVLARCYVRPPFRGTGLYRKILHHRLSSLISQSGASLKAVHMGTADERVAQTITDRSLPWNGFVRIGWEDLSIGTETVRVGGYLLFSPDYAQALLKGASDLTDPAGSTSARDVFERLLAGRWCEPEDAFSQILGILSANPVTSDAETVSPIREMVEFCASIPLIYTPVAEAESSSTVCRKTFTVENCV